MTDAIDRQAAIDITMETVFVEYEDGDPRKEESIILQTKAAIRDRIKALPPVQPKRGKWIKKHWKAFRCSECNRISEYSTNFCPNCGADMKGEEHNADISKKVDD